MHLVIANKLKPLPYLEALLQKDEDTGSEELDGDEKRLKQQQQQAAPDAQKSDLMQTSLSSSASIQQPKPADLSGSYDTFDSEGLIDNPYLRPIVMPKLKVGSRKSR